MLKLLWLFFLEMFNAVAICTFIHIRELCSCESFKGLRKYGEFSLKNL